MWTLQFGKCAKVSWQNTQMVARWTSGFSKVDLRNRTSELGKIALQIYFCLKHQKTQFQSKHSKHFHQKNQFISCETNSNKVKLPKVGSNAIVPAPTGTGPNQLGAKWGQPPFYKILWWKLLAFVTDWKYPHHVINSLYHSIRTLEQNKISDWDDTFKPTHMSSVVSFIFVM